MNNPLEEKEECARTLVHRLILDAYTDRATDVHMEPLREGAMKLRYRLDGALQDIRTLSPGVSGEVLRYLKKTAGIEAEGGGMPARGTFTVDACQVETGLMLSLKLGVLPTMQGERVTLSVSSSSSVESVMREGFEALGLQGDELARARSIFDKAFGLVLVTGTAGSGKTTTCYSALNYIRMRTQGQAVIIALEEDIAFPMEGIVQVKVDRESTHLDDHLEASMWQDPDVIFVSSPLDRASAKKICEMAMTGHMVIVQMESPDVIHAFLRLRTLIDEPSLLASVLEGAIGQRLVRRICRHCREEYVPPRDVADRYLLSFYQKLSQDQGNAALMEESAACRKDPLPFTPSSQVSLYRGKGCEKCRHSGFKGQAGLFEIMNPTMEIKDLITTIREPEKLKDALLENGFMTLREKALFYALSGVTTLEEALRVTYT